MGDRASVAFKNGDEESVALFSHWGGMDFVETAREYVKELNGASPSGTMQPFDRREPNTMMVDFVRWMCEKGHITLDKRVSSNLYFGKDGEDGDNSDNGHHAIKA